MKIKRIKIINQFIKINYFEEKNISFPDNQSSVNVTIWICPNQVYIILLSGSELFNYYYPLIMISTPLLLLLLLLLLLKYLYF